MASSSRILAATGVRTLSTASGALLMNSPATEMEFKNIAIDAQLILSGLPQLILQKILIIDGNEITLSKLIELGKTDINMSEALKAYICDTLLNELDNKDFDVFAIHLFKSYDIDYAKALISQLNKRYEDGVNTILVLKTIKHNYLNKQMQYQETDKALRIAAHYGSADVARLLLKNGAQVDAPVIGCAMWRLDYDLVRDLIQFSDDINRDVTASNFELAGYIRNCPNLTIEMIECKRAKITGLLLQQGLSPLTALEGLVFSDMEVMQIILLALDTQHLVSREIYRQTNSNEIHEIYCTTPNEIYRETKTRYLTAYVIEELDKLKPEQLSNPEPLRLFLKTIGDKGYNFNSLPMFYAIMNAALYNNIPLIDLLAEAIINNGINPHEVIDCRTIRPEQIIIDRLVAAFERQGQRLAALSNQPYKPFFQAIEPVSDNTNAPQGFYGFFSKEQAIKSEAEATLAGYRHNLPGKHQ